MRTLLLSICLALPFTVAEGQNIRTPAPGSAERTAICDAMRDFVARKYAMRPLPKPVVFKVESIRVQGDYCHFEGYPLFKDGTRAIDAYFPDVVLSVCLERGPRGWRVIYDLSRNDVPSAAELRRIRNGLPKRFPRSVLSPFWQEMLGH